METDKDPTFAEALLALAIAERNWHNGAAIGDAWEAGVTDAAKFVSGPSLMTYAPHSILRALGVDKPHGDGGEWWEREERSRSKIAALESQLAAAVARAEKAEEQMRHDGEARRMEEAGRASAIEAMCASERELDALRAELEEAMVSRSGLEAYSRQMAKDRDKWNAQCAAAEIECAKLRSERDSLRAELDKAKAELAHVEKTLATYNLVGPVGSRVAAVVESREFQTSRAVQMESERDALAAKLADKEAARVRIYKELIAYQHERDRLAVILDRAGRVLDEVAAREARLDAKEHG